ncbi:thump-domain-containing protein [Basidiobolus meristosporus CBS 931.73]|uniref:Thump-domain-containing protein n=1 Tax=Basidiobolus meristosporus CBS 931.73 TaxID=1314790 RepID=A0A1Y1XZ16_9FUNG|nr:thump-domain-containing protein [Basidiobolus meristosporus CBS 931.73]|eukprot:ORX90736.1 thump-domain-containing protein [Basidiobolus meristosporus CBS 931.73]
MSGAKRPFQTKSTQKKKRAKKYACSKEKYANPGSFQVDPGVFGFFVTCPRHKERACVSEMYAVLSEYADKLYPSESQEIEEKEVTSVEDEIANELAEMKKTAHKDKRFANLNTQVDCVVFIKTKEPIVPTDLAAYILKDLKETGVKKTRFALRLIPISNTCYANMSDIEAAAKKLLAPHFHGENQEPVTYAIVPKIRNNSKIDRDELIKSVAGLVGDKHKVNLEKPDFVIIIEIFKSICGISVVKDYYELKKFNLQVLFESLKQPKAVEDKAVEASSEA